MNDGLERIRKEAVVACSKYCPGINCEELRKSTKNTGRKLGRHFPSVCLERQSARCIVTILTELSWFPSVTTETFDRCYRIQSMALSWKKRQDVHWQFPQCRHSLHLSDTRSRKSSASSLFFMKTLLS